MNRFALLATVALAFVSLSRAAAETPTSTTDPIIGHWIWQGDKDVTVFADGTAHNRSGVPGQWKFLENKEIERKYEFEWKGKHGHIYIDSLRLSADHNKLEGRNQEKQRVWATRVKF